MLTKTMQNLALDVTEWFVPLFNLFQLREIILFT